MKLEDMTEPQLAELMTAMAKRVEGCAREHGLDGKPLFCLVLFNDPKIAQYIANCDRPSMIAAMRETADRLERREDVTR